jgi:hypothetical protein
MTYIEFKNNFNNNILPNKPNYIREGQALINYLGDIWFEEYKRLSSVHYYDETNIDCFYNDSLIPNTWDHLRKVWFNYPN